VTVVVADTGALYALVDASDAWHARVVGWWGVAGRGEVVVPVTVLPELAYLLQTRIGPAAESAFIRAVVDGEFPVEPLEPEDVERAAALMERYEDAPLGFVDATVVALCERLETRDLLTTDRRHFALVRPRHAKALALHP
jgi:predicted nucleic acid-binding protein